VSSRGMLQAEEDNVRGRTEKILNRPKYRERGRENARREGEDFGRGADEPDKTITSSNSSSKSSGNNRNSAR